MLVKNTAAAEIEEDADYIDIRDELPQSLDYTLTKENQEEISSILYRRLNFQELSEAMEYIRSISRDRLLSAQWEVLQVLKTTEEK